MNTSKRRSQQTQALSRRVARQHEQELRLQQAKTHRAQQLFNGLVVANDMAKDPQVLVSELAQLTGFEEAVVNLWRTSVVPDFVFERLAQATEQVQLGELEALLQG